MKQKPTPSQTPPQVIDGATLLSQDFEPSKYYIAKLMSTGLHILAGSPKIGKSWLALWLCHQIATGGKVWGYDTKQCTTLYFALEDTLKRIHARLSTITDHQSTKDCLFTTKAKTMKEGLLDELSQHLKDHPTIGFIIIDTFQKIRDTDNDFNYANDYKEVAQIKAFADKHEIAILLIHHLRKQEDSDPVNMISGTTGISGAVDTIYVLSKVKRSENEAILSVTGRDVTDMQLKLELDLDPPIWRFVENMNKRIPKISPIIIALQQLMETQDYFKGIATELFSLLSEKNFIEVDSKISSNNIKRKIEEEALTLEKSYNIKVSFNKTKSARFIILERVTGDSNFSTPSIKELSPVTYDEQMAWDMVFEGDTYNPHGSFKGNRSGSTEIAVTSEMSIIIPNDDDTLLNHRR